MRKLIYCLAASLLILGACSKYKNTSNDASGSLHLRGRLFYADTLTMSGLVAGVPLAAKTVNIGYAANNANDFIYSVTTDANGYFNFTNLKKNGVYQINAKDTENGIIFYGAINSDTLKASVDTGTLVLYPSQTFQNGMWFHVVDNSKPQGQPVNKCVVCLFLSKTLAQADSCAGASYMLTTNAYGNAFVLNVPAGLYYANIQVQNGLIFWSAKDSVKVGATGISGRSPIIVK